MTDLIKNPISLPEVLKHIANCDLVLGNYQREFVWDIDRSCKLLNTVYKDKHINAISLFRFIGDEDSFPGGMFRKNLNIWKEEDDRTFPISKEKVQVGDGQQRLQTLFSAFYYGDMKDWKGDFRGTKESCGLFLGKRGNLYKFYIAFDKNERECGFKDGLPFHYYEIDEEDENTKYFEKDNIFYVDTSYFFSFVLEASKKSVSEVKRNFEDNILPEWGIEHREFYFLDLISQLLDYNAKQSLEMPLLVDNIKNIEEAADRFEELNTQQQTISFQDLFTTKLEVKRRGIKKDIHELESEIKELFTPNNFQILMYSTINGEPCQPGKLKEISRESFEINNIITFYEDFKDVVLKFKKDLKEKHPDVYNGIKNTRGLGSHSVFLLHWMFNKKKEEGIVPEVNRDMVNFIIQCFGLIGYKTIGFPSKVNVKPFKELIREVNRNLTRFPSNKLIDYIWKEANNRNDKDMKLVIDEKFIKEELTRDQPTDKIRFFASLLQNKYVRAIPGEQLEIEHCWPKIIRYGEAYEFWNLTPIPSSVNKKKGQKVPWRFFIENKDNVNLLTSFYANEIDLDYARTEETFREVYENNIKRKKKERFIENLNNYGIEHDIQL